MKHFSLSRVGGALTAAVMLLTQLAAFPAGAARQTTKDIEGACDYYQQFADPINIKQGKPQAVSPADAGVPADKDITEVWLDVTMDASSGLPAMPAIGYITDTYINDKGEETTWAGDGLWMNTAASHAIVQITIPKDKPFLGKLEVQIWGDEGKSVEEMQLNTIGYIVSDHIEEPEIGMVTRLGDVNCDKTVDVADVVALSKYLTCESDKLDNAANGDLDKNKVLNANDLTLLKRGILDGSFNQKKSENIETGMEFVSHIKLGWNLGNSLDSQSPGWAKTDPDEAEQSWGNPSTTKEMIDQVKAAGFNLVRIPVSWGAKMDGNTYKINDNWMNHVQKIVNYVIDNDMYCIINIHHDNSKEDANTHAPTTFPYFYPDSAHYEQSEKFVTAIWSQVADRFEAYDNHLIFETLNEPRLVGHDNEWWIDSNNADCQDAMNCVNKLNAAALNAIRKSGGNNATRFVMMPSYAANCDESTLAGVSMPDDPYIIAEAHAYTPYKFALADETREEATAEFSESNGGADIVNLMKRLQKYYLNKGIPVIIDEFGASNRDNEDARATWAKFYLTQADSYGIPCVLWDNNAFGSGHENLGLLNRDTLQIQYPKLMAAMVEATKDRGND